MKYFALFSKKIIGVCSLMLCAYFLHSQGNTLVIGNIKNAKILKTIELRINKMYLRNEVEVYSSAILEDGSFAFSVEVDEPQVAVLEYARNKGVIYLEPNDTLFIDSDAENFQFSFQFSGGLGADNNCFNEYLQKYPRETSVFNMTQYRQKNYWYQNSPKMDRDMLAMNRPTFENHMQTRHDNSLAILEKYERQIPNKLTSTFRKFFRAEIKYDFAYHRLLYGNVFKGRYSLTDDYFDFVNEIPLQNDQIGNEWYREFLVAYFDYQNLKNPDERPDFIFQYEEGSQVLEGKTKAYYQSEIISRAFRAKENEIIIDKYWDYMRHQDYGTFDQKLIEVYSKAIKFASGTQAPAFNLKDINSNDVILNHYLGKVVYLNFWATWCRPCMDKMEKMKMIQPELEEKGIVFVNVSLDRNEEVWKKTLEKKSFKGVHILASGELNSEIARAYEVKVLPRYFIINKKGDFAKNPKSNQLEKVKAVLLEEFEQ